MDTCTPEGAGAPALGRDELKVRLEARHEVALAKVDDLDHQIGAQLRFLRYAPGDRVVVESLKPKLARQYAANWFAWTKTTSQLGQSIAKLVRAFDEESIGQYIHGDTIRPDATSRLRQNTWTRQAEGGGFTVGDVTDLRLLKIDVDPTREGGTKDVSANPVEMRRALTVGARVYLDVAEVLEHDDAQALLFSGNGVQIHVALDRIPNEPEVVAAVKRLLFVLDALYSIAGEVSIDTSLWDPRRLVPLAGTMKMKGANDEELGRIHRRTWIAVPPEVRPISREQLTSLLKVFECRLTNDQRASVESKLTGERPKMPAAPAVAQRESGDSDLHRCDALPIREVVAKLGLDPDRPECPTCKAKGSAADTSVAVLDDLNCFKCLHGTCGNFTAHPVKLVARVLLGVDTLRGNRDGVRRVLEWFTTNFNVETSAQTRRKRLQGSDDELAFSPGDKAEAASAEHVTIQLGTDTHRVVDDAVNALASDPDLYVRGNVLARVIERDDAALTDPLTIAVLRSVQLSRAASWERWDEAKKTWRPAVVPKDIAQAVHELHDWPTLRQLAGIIDTPVMRRDGSVLDAPGYDSATRLLFLPKQSFEPIPECPTEADVIAAKAVLFEVVQDFPFVASARAVWLSMLLTYFGRPMFDGPSPAFVIDANNRGAGKGLVCKVTGRICIGRSLPVTTPTEVEEELRKRITSTLMRGVGMVLVDNLPKTSEFGNGTWDGLFTAETWEDRILGISENVVVANRSVWVVTANNIRVRGDTTRRVLHVRLETPLEKPELRDPADYAHPDLEGWVTAHRATLVRAVLLLLRAWVVAGRPRGTVKLGSYESWTATIGACIQWLGLGDVTLTQGEYETRLGDTGDSGVLRPLLVAWEDAFGALSMTASEVLKRVRDEDVRVAKETRRRKDVTPDEAGFSDDEDILSHAYAALKDAIINFSPSTRGGLPDPAWFGRRIAAAAKQVAGGRRFEGEPDPKTHILHWTVARVAGANGGMAGAFSEHGRATPVGQNAAVLRAGGGIGGISSSLNAKEYQSVSRSPANTDHAMRDRMPAAEVQMPPMPPPLSDEGVNPAMSVARASTGNAPDDAPVMPPPEATALEAGDWILALAHSVSEDEIETASGERAGRLCVELVAEDGRELHLLYGGSEERREHLKAIYAERPKMLVRVRAHELATGPAWVVVDARQLQ